MNPIDTFKKFDTDNSGYIDKKELFEGLKELYKITNNEKSLCNDIFVFADGLGFRNLKDGKLNLNEFEHILKSLPKEFKDPKEAIGLIMFNLVDLDGNGVIDKKEFKKFIGRTDHFESKHMKKLFKTLAGGDDKISKAKFISFFLECCNEGDSDQIYRDAY